MERLASWRRFWLRSAILFAHSLRTSISLMQKVYLYFIYIYKGYLDNVNRFQSRKQLVVADDLVNFSFKNSARNVVERRTPWNVERGENVSPRTDSQDRFLQDFFSSATCVSCLGKVINKIHRRGQRFPVFAFFSFARTTNRWDKIWFLFIFPS